MSEEHEPVGGCLLPGAGPLVLASASPRRLELLARVGLDPEVLPADVDESVQAGESPEGYVERVARAKAAAVASQRPDALVLAADTAVVLDGKILGKPRDRNHALAMLTRLSGRTHEVLTSVVVHAGDRVRHSTERAAVTMTLLGAAELDWYVGTGEPFDKAGGYGLQGSAAAFVERVEGDPTTIIGLPLRTTISLLAQAGLRWPPYRSAVGGDG
jgi:septum formation protein